MSPASAALRAAVALAWVGCASACARDHSALAQEPTGSGGGDGGGGTSVSIAIGATTSGDGGTGGAANSGQGGAPTSVGTGGDGQGAARPEEPDGPSRVVVVQGIADRDRVGFCFATPGGDGVDVAPHPAGGLAFARTSEVPAEVLPTSGDAVVVVVAGDEDDLAGASCAELLADPGEAPALEIASLGLVPGDALGAPRILVLAATGCLGGEEHVSDLQEQACGTGYGPFSPTASLVAVSPSRIAPEDKVGFQSIGASLPAAPFDVLLRPGGDGVPFEITSALSWGASAPFPPNDDRDLASVGVPDQLSAIVTLPDDEEAVFEDIDLGGAADRAGISTFAEGSAYSIVFVGASPGLGDGPWWHGLDALFVPPDP